MSESTPDISKIIGVIMENPDIVKRISELASATVKPTEAEVAPTETVSSVYTEPTLAPDGAASKRKQLLGALRPYMSEGRLKAMDSMMAIADVLDMMKAR